MGTGCRVISIVGAILLVVLAILAVILWLNWDKIQFTLGEKLMDTVESQVARDLPDRYDLDDVKAVFKDFRDYLKSGDIGKKFKSPEMKSLNRQVQDAFKDKKIDKEELDKILAAMKDIVGK